LERRTDWVCEYHKACSAEVVRNKEDMRGMKKILIIGLGLLASIAIAGFTWFDHNQEKSYDLLLKQVGITSELKARINYFFPNKYEGRLSSGDKDEDS
jgi:hypothetical protein